MPRPALCYEDSSCCRFLAQRTLAALRAEYSHLFFGGSEVVFAARAFPSGGLYTLENRSWHASQTAKQLELRFRTLLTEGGAERLELARV